MGSPCRRVFPSSCVCPLVSPWPRGLGPGMFYTHLWAEPLPEVKNTVMPGGSKLIQNCLCFQHTQGKKHNRALHFWWPWDIFYRCLGADCVSAPDRLRCNIWTSLIVNSAPPLQIQALQQHSFQLVDISPPQTNRISRDELIKTLFSSLSSWLSAGIWWDPHSDLHNRFVVTILLIWSFKLLKLGMD